MYMLLETHTESDIITDRKKLPRFTYYIDGVEKKYTPDMYVFSVNTIFEVKSTWTYKIFKYKEQKIKSVLDAGYDYHIVVFGGDGNIEKYKKYEK